MAESRANNFDAIRLMAASAVIIGHAYPLTGGGSPGFLGSSIQSIGVKIFFVISGFLIARSWVNDPNVFRFAGRRALRILPALFLVLLLSCFVLGPAFTTLPLRDYLANARLWRYLGNVALDISYDLPGVFARNTYPVAVNGSLWSLPVEVSMYVLVPVIAVLGRGPRGRRVILWLATVGALSGGVLLARYHPQPIVFYGMSLSSSLDVGPYFLVGALYAEHRWHERLNLQAGFMAMLFAMLFPLGHPLANELLLLASLSYAVLSLGFARPSLFSFVGSRGDFSYGVYLYGWPAQQIVAAVLGPTSAITNALLALAIAFPMAIASWNLVERRALALRPRGQGKVAVPLPTPLDASAAGAGASPPPAG